MRRAEGRVLPTQSSEGEPHTNVPDLRRSETHILGQRQNLRPKKTTVRSGAASAYLWPERELSVIEVIIMNGEEGVQEGAWKSPQTQSLKLVDLVHQT